MIRLLLVWLINSVSLFIISKLPILGIEVDTFGRAVVSAAVFGILNATLGKILQFITAPLNFITLGLIYLVINVLIFGLAAKLVKGFRLKHGIVSAFLGAIVFGIVNGVLLGILLPS
ncbi:MAG: phage holin family protein [Cyanobacteria bacterium P01_A01_bin.3]